MKNIIELLKLYRSIIGTKILVLITSLTLLPPILEGISATFLLPLLQGPESDNPANKFLKGVFEYCSIDYNLKNILISIVVIISLSSFFLILQSSVTAKALNDLTVKLRKKLVKETFEFEYAKSTGYSHGYLNQVIVSEVNKVIFSFEKMALVGITFVYVLVYTAIPLFINPILVIIIGVIGLSCLPIFKWLNKKTKNLSERSTAKSASLQSLIIQTLSNFKYLKATNKHNAIQKHINTESEALGDVSYKQNILSAICSYGFEPFIILIVASLVYYFTEIKGESLIECGFIIFLLNRGIRNVMSMQKQTQKLLSSWGSIKAVKKYRQELNEGKESNECKNSLPEKFDIVIDDVSFNYGEKEILKDISLTVSSNTTVAFVGESGSGKSTLVNLIIGLLKPLNGRILLGDKDLSEVNIDQLRNSIGYITQENVIFNDTLRNNICLWENADNTELINSAIKKAHLVEFVQNSETGLETILGESGVMLSGGQRQRVSIARELYKKPSVLVCDEATSALDSATEREIQKNIDDMQGECTIILIAHRLSTVKNADKIYLLKNGSIAASGSYEELLKESGDFRDMAGLQ